MRDQRASMIQTPAEYRFVCQAILQVFHEGCVKPLQEFASSSSPAQSVKSRFISASSSTFDHSEIEKDANELIANDGSSDDQIVV